MKSTAAPTFFWHHLSMTEWRLDVVVWLEVSCRNNRHNSCEICVHNILWSVVEVVCCSRISFAAICLSAGYSDSALHSVGGSGVIWHTNQQTNTRHETVSNVVRTYKDSLQNTFAVHEHSLYSGCTGASTIWSFTIYSSGTLVDWLKCIEILTICGSVVSIISNWITLDRQFV